MVEFFAGGRLERNDLAALRIDAGHDVLDGAVFSRRVHRLKNQQHGPAVLGIEHVLQLGENFDAHGSASLARGLSSDCEVPGVAGIEVLQTKALVRDTERLGEFARLLD